MARFRTGLIVIHAVRIRVKATIETPGPPKSGLPEFPCPLRDVQRGYPGDWLITEDSGERHFCDDRVFRVEYEPVDDEAHEMLKEDA